MISRLAILAAVKVPEAPAFLTPRGAEIFSEHAARMAAEGELRADYFGLLAALAASLARMEQAEAFMAANGLTLTVRDDKGVVKQVLVCPEFHIAIREKEAARRLMAELGLTPKAREKKAARPADDYGLDD